MFATTTEVRLVSCKRCDRTVRRASGVRPTGEKHADDDDDDDGIGGVDAAMRLRAATSGDDEEEEDDDSVA